jgi:hypothetical protein
MYVLKQVEIKSKKILFKNKLLKKRFKKKKASVFELFLTSPQCIVHHFVCAAMLDLE